MSNTTKAKYSFPFLKILGLVFIVLKLAEIGQVATWSWWWVLSPFWIPLSIMLVVLIIFALITLFTNL